MRTIAAIVAALVAASGVVRAQDARQVVAEAQKRTEAKSQRYVGLLQSFDASGKTSEKRWTYERLGSHGNSKSVIRFTEPAEVRGVALLVVNHPDRASDQWMWTPAIERDRRIALQDRSTRFFGTDFTFEDLEEREVNQYTYTLAGEEVIDGAACWKVESRPKETRTSQYTKTLAWIRKDTYAFVRLDLYVKDEVVRRLQYRKLSQVQGIWTALETTMTDLKRGTLTRLALDNVVYNAPLREADFTLQALRR
jgi:hypothetical protein